MRIIWWIVIIIVALLIVPQMIHPDTVRDVRNYMQSNVIEKIIPYKKEIDMEITCTEINSKKGFLQDQDTTNRINCLKKCINYGFIDAFWKCPDDKFTCYCK